MIEPPRGQHQGQINWRGPRAYVECDSCTYIFKRPMGTAKAHFRSHKRAHQLAIIRKIEEKPE